MADQPDAPAPAPNTAAFEAINYPLRPVARFYAIAIDVGPRHLSVSFGYALSPLPTFSPEMVRNEYATKPFAKVLAVYVVDLVGEAGIKIVCKEAPELNEIRNRVNLNLAQKPTRTPLPDGQIHLAVSALRDASADAIDQGASRTEKLSHAVATLITSGPMRWIFAEAYPLAIEPQVDHLRTAKKNQLWEQVNWLLAHLLISSISTVDRLLGWRRVTQFIAGKYGLKKCLPLARLKHPRVKNDYKLRKIAAVIACKIVLNTLGEKIFVDFIDSLDKPDDPADSLGILFCYFKKVTRAHKVAATKMQKLIEKAAEPVTTINDKKRKSSAITPSTPAAAMTTNPNIQYPSGYVPCISFSKNAKGTNDKFEPARKKSKTSLARNNAASDSLPDISLAFPDDDEDPREVSSSNNSKIKQAAAQQAKMPLRQLRLMFSAD